MKADQERPKHTHVYKLKRQITVHEMYSREKIFIPERKKTRTQAHNTQTGLFQKKCSYLQKNKIFH